MIILLFEASLSVRCVGFGLHTRIREELDRGESKPRHPYVSVRSLRKSGRREPIDSARLSPTTTKEEKVAYDLPQKALEALLQGERNKAVDLVQLEGNMSREDAREVVATYIFADPSIQAMMRMKEATAGTKWGLMRWLILLQAIVVAIGYFLFFHNQW
jgi:hypothetical protein